MSYAVLTSPAVAENLTNRHMYETTAAKRSFVRITGMFTVPSMHKHIMSGEDLNQDRDFESVLQKKKNWMK